jgi:hypothetical protein
LDPSFITQKGEGRNFHWYLKKKANYVVVGSVEAKDDIKLSWKLRTISSTILIIKNDTEREEKEASIRASWEVGQTGRATRAKKTRWIIIYDFHKCREKFLKARAKEVKPKPEILKVNKDEWVQHKDNHLKEFQNHKAKLEREREQEKQGNTEKLASLIVELESIRKDFAQLQDEENKKRELYNKSFIEPKSARRKELVHVRNKSSTEK